MAIGFLLRASSWKYIRTKSPVSSIWLVAWANLASSRSTGGRVKIPGMKKSQANQNKKEIESRPQAAGHRGQGPPRG